MNNFITSKNHYITFHIDTHLLGDTKIRMSDIVATLKQFDYVANGTIKKRLTENHLTIKALVGKDEILLMKLKGHDKEILQILYNKTYISKSEPVGRGQLMQTTWHGRSAGKTTFYNKRKR